MEAPEPTCPAPDARDQPVPTPGPPGAPNGHASPRLTLGPVMLPPEQGLPPTMILKALPIPLYHTVPPGGLQPRAPLVTGSLDGGGVPFILSPLLQPEGPGPAQVGKPAAPALTVNIVGTLPVLSPGLGPMLGSPGKIRNAGKYLCPHCGRDCLKPSVLEKHIRSHTGERPFPCATCGIAFKTQSNLYKHRRTQTHLNNSRLSLESEVGGSSVLEEGDRAAEASSAEGGQESWSQRTGDGAPGRPLSPGVHVSLGVKNLDMRAEAAPRLGSTPACQEAPTDSAKTASPGLLLASTQPCRKLPEPKSCSLQRQQEVSSEKPWDAKASEGQLRKCESTDSGYLSRSDSSEQPLPPSSPLHSLSEHSAESEGEGGPSPGPSSTRTEPAAASGTSVELEKKRLEERIAQLISHNQAVVDDPQLDHVRPRKTVLSKQGSIDLPMPYTYKDSFHFDIRALEPGRRRAALSPACSTFTALDKSRPLFFHSVPTQLSTTVEYVSVTRSNSLPFVEASSTWPEPQDPQDTRSRVQKPLSPRPASARLGGRSGLILADVPSGHPRALVRQAAVEDVPCTPTGEPAAPTEDPDGKRVVPGEGAACKGRVASKKCGRRKTKMFSQEKWQVYGNETFKRIYQKMKTSHQGEQKARDGRAGLGTEPDPPPQKEAAGAPSAGGAQSAAPSHNSGIPVLGDISVVAKPAPASSLETESLKQMIPEARAGGSDKLRVARAVSSPTPGSRDSPGSGNRSPLLPPNRQLEVRWQLPPVPGPLQGGDLGAPRRAVSDLQLEGGLPGHEGVREPCPWAPAVLRRPGDSSGEPWLTEDQLPSERKKLKVEGLSPPEQPGPLGAETLAGTAQAASLPSQRQDDEARETAGALPETAEKVADPLAPSSSSSAAPAPGLGNKELTLSHARGGPGQHCRLVTQPQAPGVLAVEAEVTFAPKYLLRLPQGDSPSPLSTLLASTQGHLSICTAGPPKEPRMPWSPGPASGPVPGEADGSLEESSCAPPRGGEKEMQAGREKRQEPASQVLASGESPGSATAAPRETASLPPVSTRDALAVQGKGGESYATCHTCTDSTSAGAPTSGAVVKASSWEPRGLPEDAREDPPLKVNPCCSVQPSSFLTALTRPQAVPLGHPELPLSSDLGTPRSCGAQSPFPSLRAEPQLTWCCLKRSLPLPQEQEKAASAYSALHFPGGGNPRGHPEVQPTNNGGCSRAGPGGAPAGTPKLSCLIVSGMRSQDRMSDPEWKKGLFRRRAKTTCGNSKQKKLRINPKRCDGNFWQNRAQLRASRLRKPTWGPRRSCPPPPLGQASPAVSGLSLQAAPSCVASPLSLGPGDTEQEDAYRHTSETTSPGTSSGAIRDTATLTGKAISPSAGEPGDCSPQEDTVVLSGSSLQQDTCLAMAQDDSLPTGKGLDVGLLETHRLPSQDQVSIDPKSCNLSDAQEPSSSGPKETPCHDIVTSAAAICISLGVRVGHTRLGIHSSEPHDHSWAVGGTLAQSFPDRRAVAEGTSEALLPGNPSSGQAVSALAPLDLTDKTHLEIPTSGPSSTSSHQEEGKQLAVFPSRGQHACGETATSSPPAGSHSGQNQASGLIALKGCVAPSQPGQPSEVPEAPAKSVRKRSLEALRTQTRVELSDSSSDDEDRLVIEI
ncbi:zinc finger protein 831 isoform X1 [Fukomys damarensis]|uniref:zinc finger protein 831 isoform X1 n=1 Tax=Fukomys damarensis TaxID=885580 RepID=UPI00053F6879|nr:zinc finger protein 831 isoform X1 [Fukomys damarensis]XP_010627051.1 zinc finger protein 831 isoform X1 [Fukomys damarensis]XP_010627052.1 zinc finger protein 831 isoform X1 [Fukomys damarensis]XP_010627053.1 zinc finger protein 831 isoform X1 [Fukomys damarensis]